MYPGRDICFIDELDEFSRWLLGRKSRCEDLVSLRLEEIGVGYGEQGIASILCFRTALMNHFGLWEAVSPDTVIPLSPKSRHLTFGELADTIEPHVGDVKLAELQNRTLEDNL